MYVYYTFNTHVDCSMYDGTDLILLQGSLVNCNSKRIHNFRQFCYRRALIRGKVCVCMWGGNSRECGAEVEYQRILVSVCMYVCVCVCVCVWPWEWHATAEWSEDSDVCLTGRAHSSTVYCHWAHRYNKWRQNNIYPIGSIIRTVEANCAVLQMYMYMQ